MKKKLALLLVLSMGLSLAACSGKDSSGNGSGEAQETQETGEEQKEAEEAPAEDGSEYFTFLDDGTTVSGLTEEGKKQTNLVIPAQAESLSGLVIADSAAESVSFASDRSIDLGAAFTNAAQLKNVELPADLSEVTFMAFGSCSGLESIVIPANVTKIDEYAFEVCSNLKEVIFEGNKCETIGEYAFNMCGFEEITLPEGLKTIDEKAFFDCDSLTKVTFPSTLESIGAHAFNVSNLTEVHFAADTQNITIDPTAFGAHSSQITVYIAEGSWMDKNQDSWNAGFGTIAYE